MSDPTESNTWDGAEESRDARRTWRPLALLALLVALLPIPVTRLQLLPSYRMHAQFLVLYAPLICVLLLAYLFYLRDLLARLMFTHVLRPIPRYPYYWDSAWTKLGRRLVGLQRLALALLPALLLAASLVCGLKYVQLLNDSVALAARAMGGEAATEADVGSLPSARGPVPPDRDRRPGPAAAGRPQVPRMTGVEAGEGLSSTAGQYALRHATVDLIPYFDELTMLYIGAFAAALVAVVLMALKEYAIDALGLTEAEVLLRRSVR
jgi:hypothetical protein